MPVNSPSGRVRTSFDPELELPKLHQWFAENPHPSRLTLQNYVKELNSLASRQSRKLLEVHNLCYWFKNARAAYKRAELRLKKTHEPLNMTPLSSSSSSPPTMASTSSLQTGPTASASSNCIMATSSAQAASPSNGPASSPCSSSSSPLLVMSQLRLKHSTQNNARQEQNSITNHGQALQPENLASNNLRDLKLQPHNSMHHKRHNNYDSRAPRSYQPHRHMSPNSRLDGHYRRASSSSSLSSLEPSYESVMSNIEHRTTNNAHSSNDRGGAPFLGKLNYNGTAMNEGDKDKAGSISERKCNEHRCKATGARKGACLAAGGAINGGNACSLVAAAAANCNGHQAQANRESSGAMIAMAAAAAAATDAHRLLAGPSAANILAPQLPQLQPRATNSGVELVNAVNCLLGSLGTLGGASSNFGAAAAAAAAAQLANPVGNSLFPVGSSAALSLAASLLSSNLIAPPASQPLTLAAQLAADPTIVAALAGRSAPALAAAIMLAQHQSASIQLANGLESATSASGFNNANGICGSNLISDTSDFLINNNNNSNVGDNRDCDLHHHTNHGHHNNSNHLH